MAPQLERNQSFNDRFLSAAGTKTSYLFMRTAVGSGASLTCARLMFSRYRKCDVMVNYTDVIEAVRYRGFGATTLECAHKFRMEVTKKN